MAVQIAHDLRKPSHFEIRCAVARVESVETEINGVGTRRNSGAHGIEITGWRQHFGTIFNHDSGLPRAIGGLAQVSFFNSGENGVCACIDERACRGFT
jgi:hypothetical protein